MHEVESVIARRFMNKEDKPKDEYWLHDLKAQRVIRIDNFPLYNLLRLLFMREVLLRKLEKSGLNCLFEIESSHGTDLAGTENSFDGGMSRTTNLS